MPRVSVIMPAYNSESYLSTSIESVIAQSQSDWELIIIDDGSTDETRAVAARYAAADSRISVLALETHGGIARARNRGIAAASGMWITLLDADDSYGPVRLETLIRLAESEDASVVIDNQFFVVGGGTQWWRTLFGGVGEESTWLTLNDLFRENRLGRMFNIGLAKPLIKTELLKGEDTKYTEGVTFGEDYLMLLRLCARAKQVLAYRRPLYYYSYRRNSVSRSARAQDLLSFRDGLTVFLERLSADAASGTEIKDMQADVEAYIQSQHLIELLRVSRITKAFLPLLTDRSLREALIRRICLKLSREIALSWPGVPPSFVVKLHGLRIGFNSVPVGTSCNEPHRA